MSQPSLYNPSALTNLQLTIKTPCPQCPMSRSKQTQFRRGLNGTQRSAFQSFVPTADVSAQCRKCPEPQPLCRGSFYRTPNETHENIMPQCPMSQTSRAAFKFQINRAIFKPKEKLLCRKCPRCPMSQTNQPEIHFQNEENQIHVPAVPECLNQPTYLYIQRLSIKWRRNKLPSSIPERIHIVATTV